MDKIKYPHMSLKEWPFQIVPDDNFCTFMADRTRAVEDIHALLRNLSRRNTSSIHLIWAWFGAGKTHTLLHICHLCKMQYKSIVPVYVEFPKSVKSFLDLYRSFATNFNIDIFKDAYLDICTSPNKDQVQKELFMASPDLSNAMKALHMGGLEEHETILRWLRAENLPMNSLKMLGIGKRIDTPESAINVFSWLIKLINMSTNVSEGRFYRILWVIDEFQRIELCRTPVLQEINGCLHAVFNRSPNCFTLFMSFSSKPEKKLPEWLSYELADRIGIEKVITLPPLNSDEAMIFVRDVLNHFRPDGTKLPNPYFPFDEKMISDTVHLIHKKKKELRPRNIMQFLNAILEEAEPLMESGKLAIITSGFAEKILGDRDFE